MTHKSVNRQIKSSAFFVRFGADIERTVKFVAN